MKRSFFLLLGLLLSAPASWADVTGKVVLVGAPNSKDETFVAKSFGCGESPVRHTENWKIGPGGALGDVVVWIVDPKFSVPPAAPKIEIKQIGCRYDPHVNAVQAGVPFKVINGDPTLHNVRAKVCSDPRQPPGADVFNFGQAVQGQSDERQFDQPGTYILRCDVHSWMLCWIVVLKDSCFAVTAPDGMFTLPDSARLLDGDYKLQAWHARFPQPLEQTLHVKNGTAAATISFDGKDSF